MIVSHGKLAHQWAPIRPVNDSLHRAAKSPKHLCKDHPHLSVRQVPAEAIPWPDREWLKDGTIIQKEGRGRVLDHLGQPSLRDRSVGLVEIPGR